MVNLFLYLLVGVVLLPALSVLALRGPFPFAFQTTFEFERPGGGYFLLILVVDALGATQHAFPFEFAGVALLDVLGCLPFLCL